VKLTIRAHLTLLYLVVIGGSFLAFFWICDFGFRRSIETTVNDASQRNLDIVQRVVAGAKAQGPAKVRKELGELSELWANGAIFEVAGPDGEWLFRSPMFALAQPALPVSPAHGVSFVTTNLDRQQYRIAQQSISIGDEVFRIDAAVPTEPFDQALDNFRLTEKSFLPLLVVLACLLGYWLSVRALAPVSRIIESAERIGIQNLSQRLVVPEAKDELRRLTETVNAMLGRIESSVNRIQQFTADASHDLRTPLSLIRTNAELALRRPRPQAEYRQTLTRILKTSEETTQLIEELLTVARADTGAVHLNFQLVNVTPLLRKAAQEASFLALSQGLDFTETLLEEALYLDADRTAIERLFLSMLDNAVKYTPSGGRVALRAFQESSFAVIEVSDTGIGISEHDLPRIFDRFYRADQARSRGVPGSGLGLAIAQWVADAHKGSIEVSSRLGEGSIFRIRLPLASGKNEVSLTVKTTSQSPAAVSESSVI
jgi:two-component system, OmpR family, heavy metal sensor histidine kinase CusS